MTHVEIKQYKWEGSWGPFTIKVPCGECDLTYSIITDLMHKEFSGKDVTFTALPWLPNWYKVIWRGGWHAPITLVNGKIITQGTVVDRDKLVAEVERQLAR